MKDPILERIPEAAAVKRELEKAAMDGLKDATDLIVGHVVRAIQASETFPVQVDLGGLKECNPKYFEKALVLVKSALATKGWSIEDRGSKRNPVDHGFLRALILRPEE